MMNTVQEFRFVDRRTPDLRYSIGSPNWYALKHLEDEVSEHVPDAKCSGDWLYFSKGRIPSFADELRAMGY